MRRFRPWDWRGIGGNREPRLQTVAHLGSQASRWRIRVSYARLALSAPLNSKSQSSSPAPNEGDNLVDSVAPSSKNGPWVSGFARASESPAC